MDRLESVTTGGIPRRGFLKGMGSAAALAGGGSLFGMPFLAGPAAAATTTYQAETARIHRGVLETIHGGFSGTAYVNAFQEAGSYVEWLVTVPRAVTATLVIRYANGSTGSRPMAVRVNGSVVDAALSFPATGSWPSWATRSLTAALRAGSNTVRLTATTGSGGPNIDLLDVNDGTDWGRAMVESTLARNPDPAAFGSWTYYRAFYLLGQYRVYQRTRDGRYLRYIRDWVDRHVDAAGNIDVPINLLDHILPGNLLLILHRETGLNKYRLAADRVRRVFDTYPRTTDGGFWHSTGLVGQLWLDGTYMALPFLARYGRAYGGAAGAYDETVNQLLIYASHLKHPTNGLLYHGYDEQGDPAWANPATRRSPEFWGRSIGWYGMALIDVLDIIPASHPRRPELVALVKGLVAALARFQDPTTGRWFQVVDKGSLGGNWLETSCSCMFTYVISRAIERGHVPAAAFAAAGRKGFLGVLDQVSLGTDGRTNLRNICVGTGVGDLAYYLARPRSTNEVHGLGAFLVMHEQVLAQNWR
ncbi:glycoside hydrolase family 88 protein (plasmid) [Skermanella rosea]|uniref:glycoside hydrolase family 88 protein n=1 Tax=Skermanella rosea TaxID=1817965 RepID=UPI00193467C9|nr:glycoside hydrolase family 88 protein [Skermanella rosea]UEM07894.1 glycoside hydrolase family 88 protein [Skermanella rosea]